MVLSLLLSGNANSLNFNENLEDYEKNNPGHAATIYVLNRCSGIMSYVSSSKHNNTTTENASNVSLKRMMQLEKLYRQDAKQMFLLKGKYLSGIVGFDFNYCRAVAKKIFK